MKLKSLFTKAYTNPGLNHSSFGTTFGTTSVTETIPRIDLSPRPFRYWLESEEEQEPGQCDALIFAKGARAKRLNLPGEDTYRQNGISACAVCDGAVPIFR